MYWWGGGGGGEDKPAAICCPPPPPSHTHMSSKAFQVTSCCNKHEMFGLQEIFIILPHVPLESNFSICHCFKVLFFFSFFFVFEAGGGGGGREVRR